MNTEVLELMVCPACKGRLVYQQDLQELWCRADKLAYPINEGIPVMIVDEARRLTLEELDRG